MANNNSNCAMCDMICMSKLVVCAGQNCIFNKYFTNVADLQAIFCHYEYELLKTILEHGDTVDPKGLSIWISAKLVDIRSVKRTVNAVLAENLTRKTRSAKTNTSTSLPVCLSSVPTYLSTVGSSSISGLSSAVVPVGFDFSAPTSSISTIVSTTAGSSTFSVLSSTVSTAGFDFSAPSSSISTIVSSTVGSSTFSSLSSYVSFAGFDFSAPSSSISTIVSSTAGSSTFSILSSTVAPSSSISTIVSSVGPVSLFSISSTLGASTNTSIQHSTLPAPPFSPSFHPHPSPPSSPHVHPPSASPPSSPPPALPSSFTRDPYNIRPRKNTVQSEPIQVDRPRTRSQVAQVALPRKRKGKIPCHDICNCRRKQCLCFKKRRLS